MVISDISESSPHGRIIRFELCLVVGVVGRCIGSLVLQASISLLFPTFVLTPRLCTELTKVNVIFSDCDGTQEDFQNVVMLLK